ncbi:RecE family exodeoxyribonuclease [Leclercia adecarboxylata]|uniref:RecE family exodeoxyribonuclease n=1 Tax=Leclercia adecarboxylata TaxID=83655 RepID=UPI0013DFCDA8|nr:RecE family exodeoxyribonuclease [Leclercia adecarboxylata]QIG28636.1 exodeoxyribonuclease [Leclercia adecarboxylata]
MEFFYVVKATQKSGKQDAVIWFTAKSAARAALTLDVVLEDADIETGRGKDYAKPVRTDMPIVDDLPEEGVIDYTWCERYTLADDQRTWNAIPGAASQSETAISPDSATSDENQPVAAVTATDTADVGSTSPLENRTPAVRFAVHLLGDKYLSEISQEQHIVANELATDEGNVYFQRLLKAKNDVADISDLSLHAEWKLVQAVKEVFPQDKEHDPALVAAFMSSWIKAEAGDRNQLVEDWKSVKHPAKDEPDYWYENGLRVLKNGDEFTRYAVCKLPFRQQLLAQLTVDELRHHVTRGEHAELHALEMDTDNSYVQTLLLAAESCSEIKTFDTKDLWRYTNAIRKVFSMDKRHELALLLQFTKAWVATPYIDRGILTREWAAGNRINHVQRTDAGTNADGGYVTDRGADAHHTLDTLDLEIACALLPMDFNHREIPGSILRRAKEIVTKKEEPWKSWSSILRNQPGVLAVNRTAIFNLVRIAPENIHLTPVAHLEFVNRTMTTNFNEATELMPIRSVSERQESEIPDAAAEPEVPVAQPGGGVKTDRSPNYKPSLDGLDTEIALATLSADFNIYDIPSDVFREAQAIVAANHSPFKEWSEALRATPGILDYSRAAIFALIRSAFKGFHFEPKHIRGHIHANLTETDHEHPTAEMLAAARHTPEVSWESEVNQQLAAEQHALPKWVEAGEQKLADEDEAETQTLPKWVSAADSQPQVANLGGGVFSIEGLMGVNTDPVINTPSNAVEKTETVTETTSDVQMEETNPQEGEAGDALPPGESADAADPQTDALNPAEVLAAAVPELPNATQPEVTTEAPEETASAPEYPAYFEPGRYEGLPNNVYHAANGISSTQVKDARVSLMYFNARHVAKTIPREGSKVLDMGNLVHALALQPENLDEEFSVEPVIPEGAFTTAATLRTFIDAHNASLPAQLSADDIKALLDEYNATLPAQLPLGASVDETYAAYEQLPEVYQRIENGTKHTATAMKACIKEYNATLPAPVKTSGSRDALLEQLAIINPDLVAQEAQKPAPLKVSGTKAEMIQAVKSVKPDAVFADELLDAWRENPDDKILVTQQQMQTALAIQKALHDHPTAGKLLLHPDRAVETSYFGIDEETGLEIRVRPDLEIDIDAVRIGADLKTISMWNVKQSGLRSRLHREIIDRDYHLSAAMYMNAAALDQFFWIFVNKDEGYHWIAIVEASEELIELGMLEYRQTMNRIANAFDTGVWPAPITEDYTDELNDFDLRRLEALRLA